MNRGTKRRFSTFFKKNRSLNTLAIIGALKSINQKNFHLPCGQLPLSVKLSPIQMIVGRDLFAL